MGQEAQSGIQAWVLVLAPLLSLLRSSHATLAEKHPASSLVLSVPRAANCYYRVEAKPGFQVQSPPDNFEGKGRVNGDNFREFNKRGFNKTSSAKFTLKNRATNYKNKP